MPRSFEHALLDGLQIPLSSTKESYGQLYGCSEALLVSTIAKKHHLPVVVIASDIHHAQQIEHEIRFFQSSNTDLLNLPDWETLPYDVFSPHQDIISERLTTLYKLPHIKPGQILVLPVATLLQRLTPKSYIQQQVLILKTTQTLDIDDFRVNLEQSGYHCVSQVMEHGEFAIRGSIIDLYPSGQDLPFRLDLFDDEIDTIRRFDPESQRSLDTVDTIELLPAREFPFNQDAIKQFRNRYRETFEGDPTRSRIYQDVSQSIIPSGIEYYLPLFMDQLETLFDYLPKNTLFFTGADLQPLIEHFWQDLEQRYEQRKHDIERPILEPSRLYLNADEIQKKLACFSQIESQTFKGIPDKNIVNLPFTAPTELLIQPRAQRPMTALIDFVADFNGRLLFIAESTGRRETLLEMLRDQKIHPKTFSSWSEFSISEERLGIAVAPLDRGLRLTEPQLCIITEPQIFGERVQQQRRRRARTRDAEAVIGNLTDLHIGAPVVHEEHGVGRYLGLVKLALTDIESEYLAIEYAGGDKLYVPVSSLHLISRYTGADADHAPQHKLGGETWQKIKRKAAEKVNDVAAEILDLHARRAAKEGYAYHIDMQEYASFADAFPFEETEDQAKAIQAVIDDLSAPQSMDRVVCGDVGFGKTEVAMRAAFIAANAGKQVAILVPTTLLSQQHYQNFKDRFADWPLKIEGLSRFKTKKQQDEVIKGLANGTVDIIIGTHKLLQKDIKFKDLGLLIIDEEHRFGVKHKEQFKNLRAEVDILTLTATPIPRTLNMSLAGLRDLSIIASPPTQRHAIKTFISEWNDGQVQEACLREIKRGGQVYILHNDVKSIGKICKQIEELVPEAKVEYAHGQMRERELEQVMLDFYHQRFNILVATTIIESGIDIPTANTIIINRADKLGLAQLHQIRGRVGRSHHRAYAYLITPPVTLMTKDALKRLEAIESLEDLGVGFTLATHDLEIRGAGELLGEGQSGQIQEIGFSLYTDLLDRAVKALKSGKIPDLDKPLHHGTEIDLGVPALLPDDYVHDVHTRLILYKRISSAQTEDALKDIRVELIDRFGLLPDAAKHLFILTELKLATESIGVQKINASANVIRLVFDQNPNIDPTKLILLLQSKPDTYRFNGKDTLHIIKDLDSTEQRIDIILDTLQQLAFKEAA
ncbi:MAG: transcription-repair coupling factor [Gammaproteobacteria bacterium]|nr:transcription-repair coupling factor [Gammaproteobacteria bacterium]